MKNLLLITLFTTLSTLFSFGDGRALGCSSFWCVWGFLYLRNYVIFLYYQNKQSKNVCWSFMKGCHTYAAPFHE